jgi:hypothetical protein
MRPIDKIRNQDLPRGQGDHSTLYMSLELSRSTWLVTSLSPNSDKMSKHTIAAGDAPKLLALLARLRGRSEQLVGGSLNVTVIQEAGLDGFWVHRSLEANDIESHVVDPASIAVSRRRRCAKTDAIDGETLLRTFLAWKRGEPRVCEMVAPPTPEQEDHRRLSRERHLSHCSRGSRQLVRRLARCFIMKASTETSPIGVMWPPMLGWYRRRGGAARSTVSKASPKPATRVCVTS